MNSSTWVHEIMTHTAQVSHVSVHDSEHWKSHTAGMPCSLHAPETAVRGPSFRDKFEYSTIRYQVWLSFSLRSALAFKELLSVTPGPTRNLNDILNGGSVSTVTSSLGPFLSNSACACTVHSCPSSETWFQQQRITSPEYPETMFFPWLPPTAGDPQYMTQKASPTATRGRTEGIRSYFPSLYGAKPKADSDWSQHLCSAASLLQSPSSSRFPVRALPPEAGKRCTSIHVNVL